MATTTDYINQLKTDKTNLANNLNAKGVSAAQNETFTSLVPKVLNIETGITPTGTINITENGTYDVTDKASANVNVDADVSDYFTDKIPPGSENGPGVANMIKTIPNVPLFNFDGNYLFRNCSALTHIPLLDTSNCTRMNYTFSSCTSLIEVPLLNTSKVTQMENMFYRCINLKTIPLLDTSNVTTMSDMFYACSSLISIPELDTSKVTNMSNMFNSCTNILSIPLLDATNVTNINNVITYGGQKLTELGGFQNLGQAYSTTQSANYINYRLRLSSCSNLTHDSLMNVINNLYDIATKGCNTQELELGSTNISKLSAEEIAIATNKGFSVS